MKFSPLRSQLLQLAISGKLTEQLDSEPEVAQLGSAPAPDEVPFAIPPKWKWVRLEQACTYIQRGKSPKYSEIKQLPVVAQKCNQWDGLHMELALFVDPATIGAYQAERFLQHGDVLVNSTGTGTIGRVGSYDPAVNPYKQAVADSHVTVIRANKALIHPSYIKYVLSSSIYQAMILEAGRGTTKQQELATATVKQMPLPLPSLEEQKRIVALIDELMSTIDRIEDAYSEFEGPMTEHFRNSALQQAMQGQLVPQLDTEPEVEQVGPAPAPDAVPFAIPDKWKWARFGELVECLDYKRVPIKKSDRDKQAKIYDYYGATGVIDQVEGYIFDKRLLLIGEDGANLLSRTKDNAFFASGKYWVNNHAHVFDETNLATLDFLAAYINSISLHPYVRGSAQPKLTLSTLKSIWTPLPPLGEQRRIVAKLEELFTGVEQLKSLVEFA